MATERTPQDEVEVLNRQIEHYDKEANLYNKLADNSDTADSEAHRENAARCEHIVDRLTDIRNAVLEGRI